MFVIGILSVMSACSQQEKPTDYSIGMIYTTEYKNKSEILFLDENMTETGKLDWNYSSMAYDGFSNSFILDRQLYLLPLGHGDKLDGGKVVTFDLDQAEKKEYDFDRVNITDFTADGKQIFITGNLNGQGYMDVYDMQTDRIRRMETPGILPDVVRVYDGRAFALAMDFDSDEKILGEFSPESGTYQELYCLGKVELPSYMEEYKGKLYFVQDNTLFVYDIGKSEMTKQILPHDRAFNLQRKENILYISHTDLFEDGISYLVLYNLETGQIEKELSFDTTIVQLEVSGDGTVYILDYEKLGKYDISSTEPRLLEEIRIKQEGDFYCGGFFLKDDPEEIEQVDNLEGLTDAEINQILIDRANEQEIVPDKTN